jgi:hypothetical protein
MGENNMWLKTAVAMAAAIGLAGCTSAPETGSSGSKVNPNSVKADDVVAGNYLDFDMCSLVDYTATAVGGMAKLLHPESFDECAVHIDATSPASFTVGPFRELTKRENTKPGVSGLPGGLTDLEVATFPGECLHVITFVDKVELEIRVAPAKETPVAACDIATKIVESVSARARDGKGTPYKSPDAKSLRTLDACKLVAPEAVKGKATPTGMSKHACNWVGPDANSPTVRLALTKGFTEGYTEEDLGAPETIAGKKRTFVNTTPAGAAPGTACMVTLNHIRTKGVQQAIPEDEQAIVRVYGAAGGTADLCALAKATANAAWPKLPVA